jgi:RNA polymerase sigma-70 factor, ECF subfamily
MSTRDMTISEAERLAAQAAGDADVAFQMDEDTFRAFYDRTARPVWVYLSRITGDRQAADDLLQEAYYRFLRARTVYENETHRRNSLFRIATNLASDLRRRDRVRPPMVPHDPDRDMSPGDAAGQVERATDLTRALHGLKPRERALLWLAYAEGSSHREIAETLGLKLGSVKLLLFRARRRMAGLLGAVRSSATPGKDGGVA